MPTLSLETLADRASPDDRLDMIFRALGDRTRRALLALLAERPARVTDIAAPFQMSLAAVGKHLRVLERAGLIERRIDGRVHRCSANLASLEDIETWLAHYRGFWQGNLDRLADYAASEDAAKSRRNMETEGK